MRFQETFLASNSVKGRLKFQKDSLKSNFVKELKDKAKWNRQLRRVKLRLVVYLESLFQNVHWFVCFFFANLTLFMSIQNAHFVNEERKFPSECHIHVVWNGYTNNVSPSQKFEFTWFEWSKQELFWGEVRGRPKVLDTVTETASKTFCYYQSPLFQKNPHQNKTDITGKFSDTWLFHIIFKRINNR